MTTATTSEPSVKPPEPPRALDADSDFAFEVPADAHTLAGFLRWEDSGSYPQRGRIDFLGGRLFIDMAAGEIHSHETLKVQLGIAVGNVLRERNLGKVFIDNTRYVSPESDSGVEPDILVCLYDGVRAGRVRFVESEKNAARCMFIEGSADLAVEIVSDSSVGKDTKDLRARYFAAGVREYWIFDARGPRMTFELLARGENDWNPATPDAEGFRRSDVLGRRVRVDRTTDPIGLPDYDVLIRE